MSALLLACLTVTSTQSVLAIDSYTLSEPIELSTLLEMVVPHAIPLTEDFGPIDPFRVSLLGESWAWTRWRIGGHDVTDPFAPGSPAVQLPQAWTGALSLGMTSRPRQSAPSGFDLEPHFARGVSAGLRTVVIPWLGGIVPGAVEIMNAISGRHVTEREVPPPEERRRYVHRLDAWATGGLDWRGGDLSLVAEVTDTTRRFLDFDPTTGALAGTFDEPASRVTLGAAWESGDARILTLFEHRERSTLGAEAGFALRETTDATTDTLLIGVRRGDAHAALTLSRQELVPVSRTFTREILDVDGEAPQPFSPDGSRLAVSVDGGWSHGPYYLGLLGRALVMRPATPTWSNPLTFAGAPYGRIDWTAAPVTVALGEARAGHQDGVELGRFRLEWDLYAWAALTGRMFQADLGADLSLSTRAGRFELFVLGSKAPIAPSPEIALALAPGWLEGRTVLLGDGLVDTWGGSRLSVDGALAPTQVYTGAIGGSWHLSPRWVGSSRVDLQACKLEYSIVSPK